MCKATLHVLIICVLSGCLSLAISADDAKTPCTTPSLQEYEKVHPGVVQLNSKLKQPELLYREEVKIPESLKKTTTSIGVTILVGIIRGTGLLDDLCLVRSSEKPEWDAAAFDAVSHWKYFPATKDGAPVPVFIIITVRPHYR
jgi:TonB-like protein